MTAIENQCCDCATSMYPCRNCGRKRTKILVCDECEEQEEWLYKYDERELCITCLLEKCEKVYLDDGR